MGEFPFSIIAFYQFAPLDAVAVEECRNELFALGEREDMCGLTIVAPEGINGTVAGSATAVDAYQELLDTRFPDLEYKQSFATHQPFKRWSVKIREEIVGLKDPAIIPDGEHRHLSPEEWHRVLNEEDVFLLDTRNTYETELGTFKGAVDPQLSTFSEFQEWVKNCGVPTDRKVLMYCTGGIRCEKALLAMEQAGYENVYQLQGGILKYLEQFPEGHFEGECFVFDRRVAVDQNLQPSQRYQLCPHCGDPGDVRLTCKACQVECIVCEDCRERDDQNTCSKNCAERYRRLERRKAKQSSTLSD